MDFKLLSKIKQVSMIETIDLTLSKWTPFSSPELQIKPSGSGDENEWTPIRNLKEHVKTE